MPRRLAAPALLVALVGCFVDRGPEASASATSTLGESTSADATATSASASTSTDATTSDATATATASTSSGASTTAASSSTTGAPTTCGDGVIDPGEACDDGPRNDAHAPGACRPNCALPACGDGSLYLGALGPAQVVSPLTSDRLGNDTPRSIAVGAGGTLKVVFLRDTNPDQVMVQDLDAAGVAIGDPYAVSLVDNVNLTDPSLAAAPSGATAVVWERPISGLEVILRRVGGDVDELVVNPDTIGVQETPAVAITADGRVTVAYRSRLAGSEPSTVHLRAYPDFTKPDALADLLVSDDPSGDVTSPALAITASGGAIVAWGAPAGALVYRRIAVDGALGPVVTTGLRPGQGKPALNDKEWVAVASIAADDGVALLGIGEDGGPRIERRDAADGLVGAASVADDPSHYVLLLDLASDAHGNLMIAWSGCGLPDDGATACTADSRVFARWFYADLDPVGPSTLLASNPLPPPSPVGVVHDDAVGAAVLYTAEGRIHVRVAPFVCP